MGWRETVTQPDEILVFLALDDDKYRWRTIAAVSRQTGVDRERILQIVASHPEYVRLSRAPSTTGEPLLGLIDRIDCPE